MAHILVIEDNPDNLELMVYLLSAFGHTALAARSGDAGLQLARSQPPELILCDIHMPAMDGYGVLRALRADPALRTIRCVAITALAMLGDREKIIASGFDGYVSKPIEPEHFPAQIEALLGAPPAPPRPVPAFAAHDAAPLPGQPARVLLVDDSAVNRELIETTLRPFGYAVTAADSVAAALVLAAESDFDLILSDLHMPGRDGLSLLAAAKADPRLASVPFVFITSSVWGSRDAGDALARGAARFLLRPIEPQALLSEISAIVAPRAQPSL